MAFTEIAQVPSHYYHLLDVRHGPMVLVGKDTLVVACIGNKNLGYQKELISDIVKRGARVVVYSGGASESMEGAELMVDSGMDIDSAVRGIPFIFIPQVLAYFKSEIMGINPDEPAGLVAWVKL
jgi:fructoselysine-6-P-deglycase FrlB-like protein